MAVENGFFNAIDHDRLYDADQVNDMFEGLIVSDGVYAGLYSACRVTALSGMQVVVGKGRGMVNRRWFRLNDPETINISASSSTLNRWTAVVIRLLIDDRDVELTTIDGTPSANPEKPVPVRDGEYYDIVLAYIYVGKGASGITQSQIVDTRPDTSLCGWIAAVVQQLDTSQMFDQFYDAFNRMQDQMIRWQKAQQDAYQSWFETLTEDLTVEFYLASYEKRVTGKVNEVKNIFLDMGGYTYESSDIFYVFANGVLLTPNVDFAIDESTTPAKLSINFGNESKVDNEVFVRVLKSTMGEAPQSSTGFNLTKSINKSNLFGNEISTEILINKI